jgi:ATPase subunit of ABC transporter with duplicated ATPase domains
MTHKPIQFKNASFSLPHKHCFEQFNASILYGQRIAVIGQNGGGKSTLLRMLQGLIEPTDGELLMPDDITIGHVPQLIHEFEGLSGGQRFNEKLTQALARYPNLLLLDEPTNHLDRKNRQSLMRMLLSFEGTLIIVTHDVELLQQTVDTIWHIDQGQIHVFKGDYDDYQQERAIQHHMIEQKLSALSHQKKEAHRALMKEQARAKKSRLGGEKKIENRKWPTVVSAIKMARGNTTSTDKTSQINLKKQKLLDQRSALKIPNVLKPTFSIASRESGRVLISITDGCVGFQKPIVSTINFTLTSGERVAISGDNGSGKSTLIKAILEECHIVKTGTWQVLNQASIGYLDQHYSTLEVYQTPLDLMQSIAPHWSFAEIRKHLNDFLFRKNEEINATIASLSGGEKARLSLAWIAAMTPKLLILDEVTNNLDLETRAHVIQVLKDYPGAMLVISHDIDFLNSIAITSHYTIDNGLFILNMEGKQEKQ